MGEILAVFVEMLRFSITGSYGDASGAPKNVLAVA